MRSKHQTGVRIAIEYVTARTSHFHDAAASEALEEASEHVYELVDGLSRLVVGLARRAAAAEGLSVADVLQREALTQVERPAVISRTASEEVSASDHGAGRVCPPAEEPASEPARVRRLQPPRQATAFYEIDEEPGYLRPDTWDA